MRPRFLLCRVHYPCAGVIVERTREQLNAILDHFSITIDNPLSVLSQEVAKRFLASAKPTDLYKARRALARRVRVKPTILNRRCACLLDLHPQ